MKNNKILRILGIAIVLSLLVVAIPATPALAAGDLRLDPDEGKIGDSIEAWGSGFSEGSQHKLYFSDERASVGEDIDTDVINYEYLGTIATDSYGSFQWFYFDVPNRLTDGDEVENVRGGTYYVYATDYYGEIQDRAEFTVEAVGVIELDDDEGPVGTEVEISGEDFGERDDITVEYDGDDVDIDSGDDETDSNGEFECTILIPGSTAGDHTITVTDEAGTEAEAVFTVEPKITVSPESGGAGTEVTVTGTGFDYKSDIEYVEFDRDDITDDIDGDSITDRYGSFEFIFIVPAADPGSYDLEVEDEDGNKAEAEFTIAAAAVSLNPTTGYVGTEVTVSGSGFKANKPVTITFDNDDVGPASTSTDGDGKFTASFTVPTRITGKYEVKASDGTNTGEADFEISTGANISQTTGNVGTELTVSGVGFIAGRTVTIKFDGTEVATSTVNADGSFSATFDAPASIGGEHAIVATDLTNTTQFTFTMESTAPPTPLPLKPELDIKAESQAYFDWEDVTDPSGVTYTLQIATDEDFSEDSIVLEKTGVTESEYTLTKEEGLKSVSEEDSYYWHVKAIDGASNESGWSGTGSFYVGFHWAMPQWVKYILFGIGALLLVLLGFWLGRRTAYFSC